MVALHSNKNQNKDTVCVYMCIYVLWCLCLWKAENLKCHSLGAMPFKFLNDRWWLIPTMYLRSGMDIYEFVLGGVVGGL